MIDERLHTALQSLVSRYGFEEIDRSLSEMRLARAQPDGAKRHSAAANTVNSAKKARKPVSAQEYVSKMDDDPERAALMLEVARRFQDKSFLPTFGDIRNFCQVYGIDEPASKSRASAIPRVFKFMATMSDEEVQGILDGGMFSGPSRVGPIADAIRANGRVAALRNRRMMEEE